jgi:hypothetical protein
MPVSFALAVIIKLQKRQFSMKNQYKCNQALLDCNALLRGGRFPAVFVLFGFCFKFILRPHCLSQSSQSLDNMP